MKRRVVVVVLLAVVVVVVVIVVVEGTDTQVVAPSAMHPSISAAISGRHIRRHFALTPAFAGATATRSSSKGAITFIASSPSMREQGGCQAASLSARIAVTS